MMNGGRGLVCGRGGGRFGGHGIGNGGIHGRSRGRGGGNVKVINGVYISDPYRLFTNEEWENLARSEFQQSYDRKCTIDKRIMYSRKKKRKTSAVGLTYEN